jgi:hypothetical protein
MRSNQIGILKSFDPHRKNDSHNLPSETGQILDEVATVKLDLVFIVTIDTASEMDALRRLVGVRNKLINIRKHIINLNS